MEWLTFSFLCTLWRGDFGANYYYCTWRTGLAFSKSHYNMQFAYSFECTIYIPSSKIYILFVTIFQNILKMNIKWHGTPFYSFWVGIWIQMKRLRSHAPFSLILFTWSIIDGPWIHKIKLVIKLFDWSF